MAINKDLLELLACPNCKTELNYVREQWLVCEQCKRKYPIKSDIPVMLIEEGDKYVDVPIDELPDPNES